MTALISSCIILIKKYEIKTKKTANILRVMKLAWCDFWCDLMLYKKGISSLDLIFKFFRKKNFNLLEKMYQRKKENIIDNNSNNNNIFICKCLTICKEIISKEQN